MAGANDSALQVTNKMVGAVVWDSDDTVTPPTTKGRTKCDAYGNEAKLHALFVGLLTLCRNERCDLFMAVTVNTWYS
jgi:hypothetical protein